MPVTFQNTIDGESRRRLVLTLPGHLAIGNLVTREILGGKLGAVDRGGEVVIVRCSFEVELPDLLGEVVIFLEGKAGDVAEMHHFVWFVGGRRTAVVMKELYLSWTRERDRIEGLFLCMEKSCSISLGGRLWVSWKLGGESALVSLRWVGSL